MNCWCTFFTRTNFLKHIVHTNKNFWSGTQSHLTHFQLHFRWPDSSNSSWCKWVDTCCPLPDRGCHWRRCQWRWLSLLSSPPPWTSSPERLGAVSATCRHQRVSVNSWVTSRCAYIVDDKSHPICTLFGIMYLPINTIHIIRATNRNVQINH